MRLLKRFKSLLGLAAIYGVMATTASATHLVVSLKSGATIEGKLVNRNDDFAWVETKYGEIALPVSSVAPESWAKIQNSKLSPRRGKIHPVVEPEPIRPKILSGSGGSGRTTKTAPTKSPAQPKVDASSESSPEPSDSKTEEAITDTPDKKSEKESDKDSKTKPTAGNKDAVVVDPQLEAARRAELDKLKTQRLEQLKNAPKTMAIPIPPDERAKAANDLKKVAPLMKTFDQLR